MSTGRVEKFEDLIAWQKARELTKNIYYIDVETFHGLDGLAKETSRLIGGLRAAVYKQKTKTK